MRNDIYLKEMGKKIKAMRKSKKMSLEELGSKTGFHLTSIWFIENGKSDVHILTLKSIADSLGVDLKDFI